MICPKCGVEKTPYHFFNYSGKWDRKFFVTGWQPGVCWQCAAPYRCIQCGETKGADQFRVQGRICHSCKSSKMPRHDLKPPYKRGFDSSEDTQTVVEDNASEISEV